MHVLISLNVMSYVTQTPKFPVNYSWYGDTSKACSHELTT